MGAQSWAGDGEVLVYTGERRIEFERGKSGWAGWAQDKISPFAELIEIVNNVKIVEKNKYIQIQVQRQETELSVTWKTER